MYEVAWNRRVCRACAGLAHPEYRFIKPLSLLTLHAQLLSGEKGEVCLKCDAVGRGFIYPEEVSAQHSFSALCIGCRKGQGLALLLMIACVLVQLLDDAERFTGGEVRKAIISVPAYFNTKQREATANAGMCGCGCGCGSGCGWVYGAEIYGTETRNQPTLYRQSESGVFPWMFGSNQKSVSYMAYVPGIGQPAESIARALAFIKLLCKLSGDLMRSTSAGLMEKPLVCLSGHDIS
eukprot:1144653-Pelagomonas_calceolata.AAC.3